MNEFRADLNLCLKGAHVRGPFSMEIIMKYKKPKYLLHATLLASALASTFAVTSASATSHREAPFVLEMPQIDGTDLYMFRSYEQGRQDFVTLIANYVPGQSPYGGPNFFPFSENGLYEIHIDNNGDAKEDITFQFDFTNRTPAKALQIGDKSVPIPLIQSGPISGVNAESLNRRDTYTVNMVRGDRRTGMKTAITNMQTGASEFDKPIAYIGTKTFPGENGYEMYAQKHIYHVNIPHCGEGRLFVGQRKEPFFVALGEIFDLFNLNPLGSPTGEKNDLDFQNINSIALEVPISCLKSNDSPIIAAYTTSSLRQGRLVDPMPPSGLNTATKEGGAWTQVSRLGNPLVNEVVIGLPDKNRFNASDPVNDEQFLTYVTNPTLPALIETLFPNAKAPNNFPRTDLVAAYLKGIPGLNQPDNVVPSEMLRLNTSIPPTAPGQQRSLGVAAGDNAGFPNGRRPVDDVVDISLRVAMGALCVLTGPEDMFKIGCKPSDAPSGGLELTDGVRETPETFMNTFPYLNTPIPGTAEAMPGSTAQ
jgi:hypothetical protein